MDFWIDQAQAILNLEEIKEAPSKFDTCEYPIGFGLILIWKCLLKHYRYLFSAFIYQLQEAEKYFEQSRLTSKWAIHG